MTDEEVLKAMKAHHAKYGNWPRAEGLIVGTRSSTAQLYGKIEEMMIRKVVWLGTDGRYRISGPGGGT